MQLLEKLGDGDPFFVRCIKANSNLAANNFDQNVVADQLRYNGIAEIAKIRKMGFAVRKYYTDFISRYRCLFPSPPLERQADVAQSVLRLVPSSFHRDFRCGTSRIFMTIELNDWFERILRCRQRRAAATVTRCMRKVAEIKKEQKRIEAQRKRREELERMRQEEEERRKEKNEKDNVKTEDKPNGLGISTGGLSASRGGFGASRGGLGASRGGLGASRGGKGSRQGLSTSVTGNDSDPPSYSSEDDSSLTSSPFDSGGQFAGLGDTLPHDGRFRTSIESTRSPSPVVHIDDEHTERKEVDKHYEKEKKKTEFWDVCQIIARERKIRDVDEDRGLQVIKVVTYILLFCILLWCAVAQKLSLVVLVSPVIDRTKDNSVSEVKKFSKEAAAKHILLTIAILIPYCLTFLSSAFKWMFDNLPFPSLSTIVLCLLVEIMHSIGLCSLAFIILPELDMVRGILLLGGVAVVPSILFPVCASDVKSSGKNAKDDKQDQEALKNKKDDKRDQAANQSTIFRLAVFALNIITLIVQFAYISAVLVLDHFVDDSRIDNETNTIVFFILSMLFVSCAYWENFVDDRFCWTENSKGRCKQSILKAKFELQEARPIISTCTSFIKIGTTLLLSWIIKAYYEENIDDDDNHKRIEKVTFSEAFGELSENDLKRSGAIITLILSAFVGHYVGYTACKLKLQRFSFCIPLILSTPLAVAIAAVECSRGGVLSPFTSEKGQCREDIETLNVVLHYICGTVVWISLYWLCRHIFYPEIERLAKTERLFMNPFYCGILFEQHLLLNRRRHTRIVSMNIKDKKVPYSLSKFNSKVNIEGDVEDDVASQAENKEKNEDIHASNYKNPKFRDTPMIYACATMWHETKYEMLQLMKSIFRMDRDQFVRRHAEQVFNKEDEDFYDFEAHILFDDAMAIDDNNEFVPNEYVKLLATIMEEAASCVHEQSMKIKAPYKVPTPYGGQVIYIMPGGNFLFIHLKDKHKIRHKKRWSQVMYMYYLLGFRIVRMCDETVTAALNAGKISDLIQWEPGSAPGPSIGRSHIFQAFDDQVLKKAQNTFLLALDGDVDFSPGAVRLLLDRMRKSDKVGAACGRIHPIGKGPVVWFQKFEYAIAHWLQKATEHVLGCVLCSPGCFSMFRGSALMDDNVMKKYTILPTEAAHHLMYDQGEDRWLCTLLLQQGYRVDYAAGSDAFTYAPEGFDEFFKQRRRWMPSTVFNIIDLLADYKNTVYVNSNISMLYILYQGALLLSTIVGPATVLMMIAGANMVVFKVTVIWGYVIALAPAIFYFILCFYVKEKTQLRVAEILTALYAFVMMIVLVGTIVTAAQESPFHPSVIFLGFLVIAFTFSALLHPKEWSCIVFGALYFLLIPTGFLLLNIYSLTNLNNVSWGTREVPKKKTQAEIEEEKRQTEEKEKKKKERGFFGRLFPTFSTKEFKDILSKFTESQNAKKEDVSFHETNKLLKELNEHLKEIVNQNNKPKPAPTETVFLDDDTTDHDEPGKTERQELAQVKLKGILKQPHHSQHAKKHEHISDSKRNIDDDSEETIYDRVRKTRNELVNPAWAECKELGNGKVMILASEELNFWESFITKYLKPLKPKKEEIENTAKSLIDLRNNIALGMAMINLLWIAVNFMFQFERPTTISLKISGSSDNPDSPDYLEENQENTDGSASTNNAIEVDLLGLLFIIFYLAILLLQFIGMIIHRWGTFQHLVSVTKLKNPLSQVILLISILYLNHTLH
ncbi:LOW QUALITY PROTEIN: chitin synthase chs-2-like [Ruditapes philippinarum]|uniref:LOW QUALITY PROTEIN: chitin synthase chs-2-like n=1 Tax=Ruditapes philippinarum TaxID=129788 RepID=UPI00295BEE6C|nr:LOW QUALITY PROTEIN: chitin synthase chs-2-like [Ruditapes philippinarum]